MIRTLLLLAVVAGSSGCAQLTLVPLRWTKQVAEASPTNPVVEVMCLWEPAEGNNLNGLPCRGFAGQILFFTPGSAQAAKVEGEVSIYVFDDVGTEADRSKPIHKFDFDAGTWSQFRRDSDLGTGYQIFVPYTRPGSYQANCSLRVRFTPKYGGAPVYSKMGPVALSGKPREPSVKQPQPEGYSVPSPAGAPARTESAPGGPLASTAPGGVKFSTDFGGAERGNGQSFQFPTGASQQMLQRLSDLEAAAASSARHVDGLAEATARLSWDAAPNGEESDAPAQSEPRSYRLSRD